ncbi:unnamed protein product [Merluccius merluccius]
MDITASSDPDAAFHGGGRRTPCSMTADYWVVGSCDTLHEAVARWRRRRSRRRRSKGRRRWKRRRTGKKEVEEEEKKMEEEKEQEGEEEEKKMEEEEKDEEEEEEEEEKMEEEEKEQEGEEVVKVAGSNISHKLRLSSVKPSDEGTYECRVIDFSGSVPQRHRAHAYLHVAPHRPGLAAADRDRSSGPQQTSRRQAPGGHLHAHAEHQAAGKELKRQGGGGGGGGGGGAGGGDGGGGCGEDCKAL